ncbi:MAG: methylase [Oscillospiraceae bacterium]|jgi:hypothetical protein|nr:methylase [Oscillospiraceae bacterium]
MPLGWDEIGARAVAFSKRWADTCREKADAQSFVTEFLGVFGVYDPVKVGEREKPVKISGARDRYIDFFWKKQIAIEMKSRGKNLGGAYQQLSDYMNRIPVEDVPDLWMVCDFETVQLWRRSTSERFTFLLKHLRKHIKRFANIAGYATERTRDDQLELNVRAAEKMAKLHDELKAHGYDGNNLEVYLVRLLFCLFAGDTGIFPKGNFYFYIKDSKEDGSDLSHRISDLFEALNMPDGVRARRTLLSEELKQFRYINGGLFDKTLPKADFNAKMRKLLIECREFDWSAISPAIFGAMFQGVMDKTQRRELGAHYTSEENIRKLINPLFMDALWKEFERVKTDPKALDLFHDKIAGLKFLDPACGCGNFLIVTYRELRRLEHEILRMKINSSQIIMDITELLKVSVEQFYGIEVEDFPCQIATAGMWLIEHQMNLRLDEFGKHYANLPLTQSATIVHGNALRMDWESVVPKRELSYILGNPPFIGYSNQSPEQKDDILSVYVDAKGKPFKTAGKIDYVAAWYYKAAQMLAGTQIRAAFVSTNSITQGEQVAAVWKPLYDLFGIQIDFGCRTFKWGNEAKGKAAVHCVIVGFSMGRGGDKVLYDGDEEIVAGNINPYLVDAPDIFIENRTKPLFNVPEMLKGSIPVDNGNLIIEDEDYADFISKEPKAERFIRRLLGSVEFINKKSRYCLWLVDATSSEIRSMPEVMKRVEQCRAFREKSKKEATRKFAEYPTRFMEMRQPATDYLAVPKVSSERRRYVPVGFLSSEIIATDLLFVVPNATLYHFGIVTSNVHMAWMRAVCGRLKSDYRYSNTLVYNNFPWMETTDEQKANIEKLAQAVLDARANEPDSSLADLYDPLTMPPELLKAHRELDRAVMKLYGFSVKDTSEAECVARLMERYRVLMEGCVL